MKVTLFKKNPLLYSSNAYLICGSWNALSDVNTLIDTGTDNYIYQELQTLSTGIGKRRVEQIILTHEHFDHAGGLDCIVKEYNPEVIALSESIPYTKKAFDGMALKVGDRDAQIFLTPGHSSDSICIYIPEEKTLFSGDTPLFIKSVGGSYLNEYVAVLERLLLLDITTVYSGHDNPITQNVRKNLQISFDNVMKSEIV
jgi:glyoxylase-like metal-dependent hydrolase (beta-lactamase superfamily II)